jgi:hypothetical protein
MLDLKWSAGEKKIARAAHRAALERAVAAAIAQFKVKAAAVKTLDELWAMEGYLRRRLRAIDEMADYRYSRLLSLFPQLIHAGYLNEAELSGLSEDKREIIRRELS